MEANDLDKKRIVVHDAQETTTERLDSGAIGEHWITYEQASVLHACTHTYLLAEARRAPARPPAAASPPSRRRRAARPVTEEAASRRR